MYSKSLTSIKDRKALSEHNGVEVKDNREKEPEPIVPAWEQKKKSKVKSFDLHPDIPMSERHNFDLANNQVEEVNKKERFHRNYAAIKVLKDCQNENRFATPDEQKILSRYVGWGGIPEAFDERAGAWHTEYAMLKNILTPEEYASARESTLTAFYTPPEVSTAIYKVLEQMGFQEGNLLEPSCGIGNFIGMLPKSMENAKVYGVELDTISAGIAQQLYQKSSIAAQGFEEVNVPDSFFDGVIGNVPFGDFKVSDKRYDKYNFLIHDYFFAKSLDKLRPGGVMALVTSKGTMDKENSNVRKYIAQRAELLGAIRLPNDTFKGNAGTEVVSDILFLQKRDRLIDIEPDWVHLDTDENGIRMNSWSQVLYGIGYSDDQIVTVALSQVGNVGGQPYWSWYGFDSRVEWCACFVSWCANECGYIDAGIIPKYAGCVNGVQWFRDRGQWADGSYEPSPGTIIFFDWEGDGVTDHTGIVQKCENGTVYTVEGNSGDTCRTKTYTVGSSVIYGYGIPAY